MSKLLLYQKYITFLLERELSPVKVVAVDTNEECETGSQPHTGTKDRADYE